MKFKNILITGGAGFIGANLSIMLKCNYPSWNIISFDNLRRRGSELNVRRLKEYNVNFIHGDIRIMEDIECAGEFDLLVECSAEPSVFAGYGSSPVYLYQTNLCGTLNCLELCRRKKAGIVFLSTSRVYPMRLINSLNFLEGETRFIPLPSQNVPGLSEHGISEEFPLHDVRSLYGSTKLCSEYMIQEFMNAYGIKGIINRCGVITGPWQMGKVDQGFVVLWLARHLWQGELSYIGYGGKGKQVRDILHVRDLYDLLCFQLERLDEISGSVFNVGGGMDLSISLYELTQICQEITGQKIPINSVLETREADIPYYVSDCRKVQKITGWRPYSNIEKIIGDIYSWLCKNETILRPILC